MIRSDIISRLFISLALFYGFISIPSAYSQAYPGTRRGEYIQEHEKSKIDDQLIKVGEKNQYLYTYPKLNISVNPFSPLYERLSVSASYALTMNIAIRGDISVFFGDDSSEYSELGSSTNLLIGAPVYFKKVYSGFYLEPGLQLGEIGGYDLLGFQVMAGWHWMWDSGLNVSTAFGLGRNLSKEDNCDTYGDVTHCINSEELYPAANFRVGYAF